MGATVEVPTLDKGKAELSIPAGTQPGETIRMKDLGIPRMDGHGRGHQYVRIKLVVPKKLTTEQKELLRKFSGGEGNLKKGLFGKGKG